MAISVTALRRSSPSRSRSWVSTMACSSGVRSRDRRGAPVIGESVFAAGAREAHGVGRVGLPRPEETDQGLGVAHVHGEEHVTSPRSRRVRCR